MKTPEHINPFVEGIKEVHHGVEMLHLLNDEAFARDSVKALGEKTIDGVTYNILEDGLFYDVKTIDGDELALGAPDAAAHFGITMGSGSVVDIGLSTAFVDTKGKYHPPKSFFTFINILGNGGDESSTFELTDGGLVNHSDPDAKRTFSPHMKGDVISEEDQERHAAQNKEASLLHLLGLGIEIPDDLREGIKTPPSEDEKLQPEQLTLSDPKEAEAMISKLARDGEVTQNDLTALKDIIDFVHRTRGSTL